MARLLQVQRVPGCPRYPQGHPCVAFFRLRSSVDFPKAKGYPHNPKTIGEHIRKVRMDKELLQAEVAAIIGVTEICITNWENGRGEPQIRYISNIIAFLGYNPVSTKSETLREKIRFYRQQKGLSHKRFSKLIGVDAATISAWENGENKPLPKHLGSLLKLVGSF